MSPQLFDRVQEAFASHNRHKYRKRNIHYSGGLITCGYCDHAVTVEVVKNKYPYARCSKVSRVDHPKIRVKGEEIESQLESIVQAVRLPDDVLAWVRELIDGQISGEAEWHKRQVESLRQQSAKLRGWLDAAYIDKLDGLISEE